MTPTSGAGDARGVRGLVQERVAIYQINTRQFTDEGTIAAASSHLPRLRDLGVRIR